MTLNIRNAEDAATGAWQDLQRFLADWQRDWTAPYMSMATAATEQTLVNQWDQMPPQAHAVLQAQNPQGYNKAAAKIAAIKKKQKLPAGG